MSRTGATGDRFSAEVPPRGSVIGLKSVCHAEVVDALDDSLMKRVDEHIIESFPGWFRGPIRPLSRGLLAGWSRWSRLPELHDFLERHRHQRGMALVESGLRMLDARYLVDDQERERIPQSGPVLVVANHPLGALDALLLLKCLTDIRPDVRIVANELLTDIEGLRDLLLPVPVFGGSATRRNVGAIDAALARGEAVIVFPAARVSRLGWRGVADGAWRKSFVSLARKARAFVLPVFVDARNSPLFYSAALIAGPLGTALLPGELMRRRGLRARIRIDHPLDPESLDALAANGVDAARVVRDAVHALPRRDNILPKRPEALRHRADLRFIRAELGRLTELGKTRDGKRILCGRLHPASALMRELAVARERTFRAVGEGTGLSSDVDRFDAHYEQILLWDDATQALVGGYRIAACAEVLAAHGIEGLYTSTLFRLDRPFVDRLDPAAELGRSFVVPEHWGSRSLDYLWVGIGAWLRRHPGIRNLLGPVSISAALPADAQKLLVAFYGRYFADPNGCAAALRPVDPGQFAGLFRNLDRDCAEQVLKHNLAALGARIPTLYKQYVDLCEPDGVRFLAFSTDPAFRDAVDGLVWLDLDRVQPRKRDRYLMAQD